MRQLLVIAAIVLWAIALFFTLPEARSFTDGAIIVVLMSVTIFTPIGLLLFGFDLIDALWRKLGL